MFGIHKIELNINWLGVAITLLSLLCITPYGFAQKNTDNKFVVVLDAGHGGSDAGAIGIKGKEKNINLGVVLKVGKLIEANMPDVKVIYTRKTDKFVGLKDRTEIAHKNNGNLFISIHANSVSKKNKKRKTIKGASTYVLGLARSEKNLEVAKRENAVIMLEDDYNTKYEGFDPNSPESYIIFETMQDAYRDQSIAFAGLVQDQMVNIANRHDSGVRQNSFYVLAYTGMPSVLVELDFICNPTQEKFMLSESGQNKMAQAIYNAFAKYKASYDGKYEIAISDRPDPALTEDHEHGEDDATEPNINDNTKGSATTTGQPIYKVQFMALPKELKKGDKAFKGLSPVEVYRDGKYYKYTYGSATSREAIQKDFAKVRKLFRDAFIIVMKDGKRIE